MLDLGVGGGRTTPHFIGAVREYVAVDYAPRMVDACRRRFPDHAGSFHVGDARELSSLGLGHFDFVFYSYNGIDYMDHEDRLATLVEVRRVSRPGSWFCFSSHNLRSLGHKLRPHWSWNPASVVGSVKTALLLRLLNAPSRLADWQVRPQSVVRDLPRTETYYVAPSEQVVQLSNAGFSDIRMFSSDDGEELVGVAAAERSTAGWIYYLCRA